METQKCPAGAGGRPALPDSSTTATAGSSTSRSAIPIYRAPGDEGAVTSVGSKGDSGDNALAESVNGLYEQFQRFTRESSASQPQERLADPLIARHADRLTDDEEPHLSGQLIDCVYEGPDVVGWRAGRHSTAARQY